MQGHGMQPTPQTGAVHTQAGIGLEARTVGVAHHMLTIGAEVGVALPGHRRASDVRARIAPRVEPSPVTDDEDAILAVLILQATTRLPLDNLAGMAERLIVGR